MSYTTSYITATYISNRRDDERIVISHPGSSNRKFSIRSMSISHTNIYIAKQRQHFIQTVLTLITQALHSQFVMQDLISRMSINFIGITHILDCLTIIRSSP